MTVEEDVLQEARGVIENNPKKEEWIEEFLKKALLCEREENNLSSHFPVPLSLKLTLLTLSTASSSPPVPVLSAPPHPADLRDSCAYEESA